MEENFNSNDNKVTNYIGNKVDDFKKSWLVFVDGAKREGKETKEAVKILSRLLKGGKITDKEKVFLRNQSKDLARIVTIMGLGAVSMAIPIALEKILNKYGISIMPKDNNINNSVK